MIFFGFVLWWLWCGNDGKWCGMMGMKWWKMMGMMGMFSKVVTCRSQILGLMVSTTRWRDEPRAATLLRLAKCTGSKKQPRKRWKRHRVSRVSCSFGLSICEESFNIINIIAKRSQHLPQYAAGLASGRASTAMPWELYFSAWIWALRWSWSRAILLHPRSPTRWTGCDGYGPYMVHMVTIDVMVTLRHRA